MLACICVGQMLGRFGHVRAFLGLALISAVATALLPLFPNDWAWVRLRVITGFCFGGLSTIVEGWLVEQAGSGIGFASYMVVNLVASLLGTVSLGVIDVAAARPLLLAAAAVALSAVPIAFGRLPRPPIRPTFRPRLGLLIRRSPLGTFGCSGAGIITGVIGGLAPVFGMMSALSMRSDTLMLAANSIGGAIAYLPLSMLAQKLGAADPADRRDFAGPAGLCAAGAGAASAASRADRPDGSIRLRTVSDLWALRRYRQPRGAGSPGGPYCRRTRPAVRARYHHWTAGRIAGAARRNRGAFRFRVVRAAASAGRVDRPQATCSQPVRDRGVGSQARA